MAFGSGLLTGILKGYAKAKELKSKDDKNKYRLNSDVQTPEGYEVTGWDSKGNPIVRKVDNSNLVQDAKAKSDLLAKAEKAIEGSKPSADTNFWAIVQHLIPGTQPSEKARADYLTQKENLSGMRGQLLPEIINAVMGNKAPAQTPASNVPAYDTLSAEDKKKVDEAKAYWKDKSVEEIIKAMIAKGQIKGASVPGASTSRAVLNAVAP